MTDTLSTDFALMGRAAAATDARSAEVRALLQTFLARMTAVPPSVWSGPAATVFHDAVGRWSAESNRLCSALDGIAATIRSNEQSLREAADTHARHLGAAAADL
ncbi:WXG100 family type VII secretion target [Mycobacterium sp. ACS4331]|uniref:WXG100 family type VII secretion target n=1 Tax=Mycobacterium sp. ACS4331 TaxID=1834121 RepID=UPI0007FE10B1|nr:WXG100 family type VII secretion target [Mycobacterium sp. ACS4331]OBF16163.1 type VII secretion protein EsxU [Mycobacterium sp. ACS4331]